MLKERFREMERHLLVEIKSYYGKRLIAVVVFGSIARETMRYDSDVDFLIVAKGLPRGRMKRVEEFAPIEERLEPFLVSLQRVGIHTSLSPVFKTPEEAEGGSPLFLDMVEDARILFDKEGFFAAILHKLRARLQALGAKRIWRGSAWYWDLKPDYQPGEVIEL